MANALRRNFDAFRGGLFKPTGLLALLAAGELGLLAAQQAELRSVKNQLQLREAEATHLILQRDQWVRSLRQRDLQAKENAPAPEAGANSRNAETASEEASPEAELAEAAIRARAAQAIQAPAGELPGQRTEEADAVEESFDERPRGAQGKAESNDPIIDPRHLVNMVNLMTGRKDASFEEVAGKPAIVYRNPTLDREDPIWLVLDAATQARALGSILLVGSDGASAAKRKRWKEELVKEGFARDVVQLKDSDTSLKGLNGMVIRLSKLDSKAERGTL